MAFIKQKIVTTRKTHNCSACGSLLPIGIKVDTSINVDDGRISTCYWCAFCVGFMATMDPGDLEFGFDGDIWEYDGYKEFVEAKSK